VFEKVNLGHVEHLGCPDNARCLIHQVAGPAHFVALEGKESSVLHPYVGDCLGVLLRQGTVECLVKELFHTLVGAHAALKAYKGKGGLDVPWGDLVGECFVEHARFRNLLLLLFEEGVFDHKLDKVSNVL